MQQYVNTRLIKRNTFIGKALTFSGLALLIGSLVLSFTRPKIMNQLFIVVIFGTLFSQIGIAFYGRWGRKPRFDELLDDALKGLDNRYASFHYNLGTSHSLLCPAGAFALMPHLEDGEITYTDSKWWQKKVKVSRLRRPGRKALKRLSKSADAEVRALSRAIHRVLPDETEITIRPILVFINEDALIKADNAPILTVHIKKLKSTIRRLPKSKSINAKEIELLATAIGM